MRRLLGILDDLRDRMDIAARRLRTLKTPSSSNGIVRWD